MALLLVAISSGLPAQKVSSGSLTQGCTHVWNCETSSWTGGQISWSGGSTALRFIMAMSACDFLLHSTKQPHRHIILVVSCSSTDIAVPLHLNRLYSKIRTTSSNWRISSTTAAVRTTYQISLPLHLQPLADWNKKVHKRFSATDEDEFFISSEYGFCTAVITLAAKWQKQSGSTMV